MPTVVEIEEAPVSMGVLELPEGLPDMEEEPCCIPHSGDGVEPDDETVKLLAEVDTFAARFRSINDEIDSWRPTIVRLKKKFKVSRGHAGIKLFILVPKHSTFCAMAWEEYCFWKFGVTSHRMNQLLITTDEKDTGMKPAPKTPDEEKPLFQKGYKAALKSQETMMAELGATLDARILAKKIGDLQEEVETLQKENETLDTTAGSLQHYAEEMEDRLKEHGLNTPDEPPSEPSDLDVIAHFAAFKQDKEAMAGELRRVVRHFGLARSISIELI